MQFGDRLAQIAIVVHDLVDAECIQPKLAAMERRRLAQIGVDRMNPSRRAGDPMALQWHRCLLDLGRGEAEMRAWAGLRRTFAIQRAIKSFRLTKRNSWSIWCTCLYGLPVRPTLPGIPAVKEAYPCICPVSVRYCTSREERGRLEHLPRIHEAVRVERALDGAHHVQLEGTLVALDLVHLEDAQAVLGADGTAQRVDDLVHDVVHVGGLREEALRVAARLRRAVVVDVAVAQVAEGDDAHVGEATRELRAGALDQLGHAAHRHGHVVLDRYAL